MWQTMYQCTTEVGWPNPPMETLHWTILHQTGATWSKAVSNRKKGFIINNRTFLQTLNRGLQMKRSGRLDEATEIAAIRLPQTSHTNGKTTDTVVQLESSSLVAFLTGPVPQALCWLKLWFSYERLGSIQVSSTAIYIFLGVLVFPLI